tara:strand:+ start:99397 stop:101355 length:1959 start_codon:yes stop_codon:yes gene_type:complete
VPDLHSVLFYVCLLLSFWNLTILIYQGAVLGWNGRRSSSPALVAGLSLMLAGAFFVFHSTALHLARSGDWEMVKQLLPGCLFMAASLASLFLLNVILSERERQTRSPVFSGIPLFPDRSGLYLSVLALTLFTANEASFTDHSISRAFATRSINPGLILLGLACGIPVVFAVLVLGRKRPGVDEQGKKLLARSSYWLFALLVLAVISWFVGWQQVTGALVLDLLAQLSILIALIQVSQASVRYEVFSGHMPRLGMLLYFRKTLIGLFVVSVLNATLYMIYSDVLWPMVTLSLISLQAGYVEYRLMKDRERLLMRMQPFARMDVQEPLFRDLDRVDPLLFQLREELGLQGIRIQATGTYGSILGDRGMRSSGDIPPNAEPSARIQLKGPRGVLGELQLYGQKITKEEQEFARSTAERLLDYMALFRFSRTLVLLQQDYMNARKLSETSARRILHDEVLPEIHSLILEGQSPASQSGRLAAIHKKVSNLLQEMPGYDNTLLRQGLLEAIRETMNKPGYASGHLQIHREPDIDPAQKEVVFFAVRELLRNAVSHGSGVVELVEIPSDDPLNWMLKEMDRNENPARQRESPPKIPKTPATHPSPDSAGTGQGLAIHSAMLLLAGGGLEILKTEPGFAVRVFLKDRQETEQGDFKPSD